MRERKYEKLSPLLVILTLRDLINTGKITSFINYIIVETDIKKEDNELVEKILKKWKKIIYIWN